MIIRHTSCALVTGVQTCALPIFVNLVDNAVRYTPAGGVITVRVGMEGSSAQVVVEDNGSGMSQSDIERAGLRFRRGKAGKNTAGAGLGLAIVQAIMQDRQSVV